MIIMKLDHRCDRGLRVLGPLRLGLKFGLKDVFCYPAGKNRGNFKTG